MPEPVSAAPDVRAPSGRGGRPQRERHVFLALRAFATAALAYALTVVAWIATTLTLLPLALRGRPIGRRPVARSPDEPAAEPAARRALRL